MTIGNKGGWIVLSLCLIVACGPGKANDTGSGDGTSTEGTGDGDGDGDGDGTGTGGDGDGIEQVCTLACDKFNECFDDFPDTGGDAEGGEPPSPEPDTGGGGGMATSGGDGDGDGDGDVDPDAEPRDECTFSCIEEYGWSGQISEECASAYVELIKCMGSLTCDQLEDWEQGAPTPCDELQYAHDEACEEDWGEEGDETGWGTVTDTAEGDWGETAGETDGWGETGGEADWGETGGETDWGETGGVTTDGTSTGN